MDVKDEEIKLDIELKFHCLGIFGPHGNGYELSKSGEKCIPGALFECLQLQKNLPESFIV